jgi:hypothetical protein
MESWSAWEPLGLRLIHIEFDTGKADWANRGSNEYWCRSRNESPFASDFLAYKIPGMVPSQLGLVQLESGESVPIRRQHRPTSCMVLSNPHGIWMDTRGPL